MSWLRSFVLPIQGSAFAGDVDSLFWFITGISVFFFVGIAAFVAFAVWKYRHRPGVATPHIADHLGLEMTWTIIPTLIVMVVFFWGFQGYIQGTVAPANALEIQVTGKKWVWQFEYPDGTRSINEIHVPVNRPIKLVLTSEDVIHDFFIPTMRVKRDVVPGRYTQLWFTPTQTGVHVVQCAQYCGKGHSDMAAKISVDSEAKYQDWLETGGDEGKNMPLKDFGKVLYESKGCSTCHSLDGSRGQCPTWKGIWGGANKMADGRTMTVDENYIRKTMMDPNSMQLPGFEAIMPTFQGLLREREIQALIAFIKEQK